MKLHRKHWYRIYWGKYRVNEDQERILPVRGESRFLRDKKGLQ